MQAQTRRDIEQFIARKGLGSLLSTDEGYTFLRNYLDAAQPLEQECEAEEMRRTR